MRRRLFRLRDGVTEQRDLPYRPSCLAPLEGRGLLVGYKKGIGRFDFESCRAVQLPIAGADLGEVSFNDGICDAAGRLWIGTRHREASAPVGALYRIDGDLALARVRDGLIVSNGIAFSPDGRRMYHADSRPGRIHAYDFDVRAGTLSAPRVLIDYAGTGRRPDGCTVDAEGFRWVAEIDGWRVARYDPEGRLVREIMLRCRSRAASPSAGRASRRCSSPRSPMGSMRRRARRSPRRGASWRSSPGSAACRSIRSAAPPRSSRRAETRLANVSIDR
jgi:sugar lactone lactonase YvrE